MMSMEENVPAPGSPESQLDKLAGVIAFVHRLRYDLNSANDRIVDVFEEYELSQAEQLILRVGANQFVPAKHDVIKLAPDLGSSRIKNVFNVRYRLPILEYYDEEAEDGDLKELEVNDLFVAINYFNGPTSKLLINTQGVGEYESSEDIVTDPTNSAGDYFSIKDPTKRVEDPMEILDLLERINQSYVSKVQRNLSSAA